MKYTILDFIPLRGDALWRKEALKMAAKRHGKPFKCAAATMAREVMGKDKMYKIFRGKKTSTNVTDLRKKK